MEARVGPAAAVLAVSTLLIQAALTRSPALQAPAAPLALPPQDQAVVVLLMLREIIAGCGRAVQAAAE